MWPTAAWSRLLFEVRVLLHYVVKAIVDAVVPFKTNNLCGLFFGSEQPTLEVVKLFNIIIL
jgi:hypothetical protein